MSAAAQPIDPLGPVSDAAHALLSPGRLSWVERLVDRLNPIFVKETRQALKSRQFLGAFLLLVLVSWLISLFVGVLGGSHLEYSDAGRTLFAAYFVVLAAAIVIIVPFGAFRSLLSEREDATFEPLIISTIRPRQIVLGKLYSALLQAFLFYSAIAPFMAFTALLQGFDIAHVSVMLTMGLGASLWLSMASLAVSSIVKGRMWQTLVSLAVLAGLLTAFGMIWGLAVSIPFWWDYSAGWLQWTLIAWTLAGLSYLLLLQEVAVANLTFQADNRSTALRVICLGQFVLLWAFLLVSAWMSGRSSTTAVFALDDAIVGVGIVLSIIHWSAAGLFFSTEPDELSQRMIVKLPRSRLLRLLLAPLYPGGSRGLVFVQVNQWITLALMLAANYEGTLRFNSFSVMVVFSLYAMIYVMLAAAIARFGLAWSTAVQPLHCRVVTLVCIAVSMVFPLILLAFDDYRSSWEFHLIQILNPPLTLQHIERDGSQTATIVTVLSVMMLVGTAFSLPAMFRGLRQVVSARPVDKDHAV